VCRTDAELYEALRTPGRRAVGVREARKHLERGRVERVIVAQDAEASVTDDLVREAAAHGVTIDYTETMVELGRACGIQVGAAAAALLRVDAPGEQDERLSGEE
jgi:large subunit ribosomal protein L7A